MGSFCWQVFGEKAFAKFASNFVSLHFTDQNPYGSHKKILQFKFTLPPSERVAEMSRLISVVTYFIDAVGRYKLSPQVRRRMWMPVIVAFIMNFYQKKAVSGLWGEKPHRKF